MVVECALSVARRDLAYRLGPRRLGNQGAQTKLIDIRS